MVVKINFKPITTGIMHKVKTPTVRKVTDILPETICKTSESTSLIIEALPDSVLRPSVSEAILGKKKWIGGKWVTVGESVPSVNTAVCNTLPEGMMPENMTMADIRELFNSRYISMRYGKGEKIRDMTPETFSQFNLSIRTPSKGISLDDEVDWIYRKPSWMIDRIQSFQILPKERISMNIEASSDLIYALDRYIANGEVIVNGKIIRKVSPPKAYYKVDTGLDDSFLTRQDPITMYFREPINKHTLQDIAEITKPFQGKKSVNFPAGVLTDSPWLAHVVEHSPDDLYNLYKKAMQIDPKLAEAIDVKLTKGGNPRVAGIDYGQGLPYIERYRYRISEGNYQAIESVVNDYAKAMGINI